MVTVVTMTMIINDERKGKILVNTRRGTRGDDGDDDDDHDDKRREERKDTGHHKKGTHGN